MSPLCKTCLLLGLCLAALVPVESAVAQNSGKKVTVRTKWPYANFGYYRIKVRVAENPLKPARSTQRYYLVVANRTYNTGDVIASKEFVLQAGDSFVDVEILMPVKADWGEGAQLHIERDGNLRYDRNADLFRSRFNFPFSFGGNEQTMLIVSSAIKGTDGESTVITGRKRKNLENLAVDADFDKFPSIFTIEDLFAQDRNAATQAGGRSNSTLVINSPSVHAVPPGDLPKSWLGLSSIRTILISYQDLQTVIKTEPESFQAITQWVAAGGSLVVNRCGQNFESADKVKDLIYGGARGGTEREPWRYLTRKLRSRESLITASTPTYYGQTDGILSSAYVDPQMRKFRLDAQYFSSLEPGAKLTELSDDAARANGLSSSSGLAFFEYLQGRVFVVKDSMQHWTQSDWIRLINAMSLSGRGIHERLPNVGSETQYDFSVPGVGHPPIRGFQILLCLFVLLVGPVAYFVLIRAKRLHLMFVVVPVISALACISLLIYALFSEGLGVRGRIRSFTEIDHATNAAVSHIRHSYYAGALPGAYRFSNAEYVLNCNQTGRPIYYDRSNDQLRLTGGDIRPRMPHQLVSVQPHTMAVGLILDPGSTPAVPKVVNRFASTVEYAVLKTDVGFFEVSELEPGETGIGKRVTAAKVIDNFRKISNQLSPKVVDQFEFRRWDYSYTYYNSENEEVSPDCDELLESLESRAARLLRENTYLAVLNKLEAIGAPLSGIDYKYEFHVVRGRW